MATGSLLHATTLNIHIFAAILGLVTGAAAMALRKGERGHRTAGSVFFVAMLTMSGVGAVLALFVPDRGSVLGGSVTFYLVATGWAAVRRPAGSLGRFETIAAFAAFAIATMGLMFAGLTWFSADGKLDGQPALPYLVFTALPAFAGILDLRMIRRGGVAGTARIARHLWRLCTAMLIATLSFFLGKQQHFPEFLRGSPLLFVPEALVLAVMIYWLIRLRSNGRSGAQPQARPAPLVARHS
jgi:uncharacterized membrane protein